MKAKEIIKRLEALYPLSMACDWDNPGLHIGSTRKEVHTVLLTVDCDEKAIDYAIQNCADMIISHHPLIFGGVKQINNKSVLGNKIMTLISNSINCYCIHTNFDIAGGMAEEAAGRIELVNSIPLEAVTDTMGIGKVGDLPEKTTVKALCDKVKSEFNLSNVVLYGECEDVVQRVAISPGSGKDMIKHALDKGAEVLITGDITYHYGIDAIEAGLRIIDAGHYGLEHIFIELVREQLTREFLSHINILTMPINNPQKIL